MSSSNLDEYGSDAIDHHGSENRMLAVCSDMNVQMNFGGHLTTHCQNAYCQHKPFHTQKSKPSISFLNPNIQDFAPVQSGSRML